MLPTLSCVEKILRRKGLRWPPHSVAYNWLKSWSLSENHLASWLVFSRPWERATSLEASSMSPGSENLKFCVSSSFPTYYLCWQPSSDHGVQLWELLSSKEHRGWSKAQLEVVQGDKVEDVVDELVSDSQVPSVEKRLVRLCRTSSTQHSICLAAIGQAGHLVGRLADVILKPEGGKQVFKLYRPSNQRRYQSY